jgi:hypothetical protein
MSAKYGIVLVTASSENQASNIAVNLLEKGPVACDNNPLYTVDLPLEGKNLGHSRDIALNEKEDPL